MTPYYPGVLEDEDDAIEGDGPAPIDSIAGPQTPRDAVMQRIAQVRGGSQGDAPAEDVGYDSSDPSNAAAMQFAQQSAMTAGIGRGLNALAAGTGFKPDNSGYDAMEKHGADMAEKQMSRSAAVAKAVEDRKLRKSIADQTLALRGQDNERKDRMAGAYEDRTKAMAGVQQSKQDNSNIRAANTILNDKNAQNEVRKLQASHSAQALIDDIRAGKVTDSSNIAKQLTNMLTTIEMGSPGGQGDREAMGVNTLYTKLQGALSYISGHPNSAIPSDYLDQLESEVHATGDRAAANYKGLTDGALSGSDLSFGNPEADTGKVYGLAKQRRDMLLKTSGYDPETGQPIVRKHASGGNRTEVRRQKNKNTGAIRVTYSDGSTEMMNGA